MVRRIRYAVSVLGVASALAARGHETNFGISPATVYRRGWQVEFHSVLEEGTEVYRGSRRVSDTEGRREQEVETELEAFYGIRAHATVGFAVPWTTRTETLRGEKETASGGGDVGLIGKYRFYKRDVFLGTTYASVIGEYTRAGAARTSEPPLSSGADAFLTGVGLSHVTKFWAFWTDAGIRLHGKASGAREAPQEIFDAAIGWRPRVAELDQIDFQTLLELNYEAQGRTRDGSGQIGDSGGRAWFLSPGVRVGRGTQLFNVAIQMPIAQTRHGEQVGTAYRLRVGWEGVF